MIVFLPPDVDQLLPFLEHCPETRRCDEWQIPQMPAQQGTLIYSPSRQAGMLTKSAGMS